MSKQIFCIGVCALITAAAIFAGSSLGRPRSLPVVEAATTGSAVSVAEMTVKDDRPLPVEQWDAF